MVSWLLASNLSLDIFIAFKFLCNSLFIWLLVGHLLLDIFIASHFCVIHFLWILYICRTWFFFLSLEKLMCIVFLQDYGINFDDDDLHVALFWCKYGSKFCNCCKCGSKLCRNMKRSNSKFNLPFFYVMCISLFYFQHGYSIPTPWPSLLRLKNLFGLWILGFIPSSIVETIYTKTLLQQTFIEYKHLTKLCEYKLLTKLFTQMLPQLLALL